MIPSGEPIQLLWLTVKNLPFFVDFFSESYAFV